MLLLVPSKTILIVLCFGVELMYSLFVMLLYFQLSSGNLVVSYWTIAAHSTYDMFS